MSVLLARPLNQLAGQHWRTFSRQNYFQPSGLFVSVVWSMPCVLLLVLQIILLLIHVSQLMIQVKRRQLRRTATASTSSSSKGKME